MQCGIRGYGPLNHEVWRNSPREMDNYIRDYAGLMRAGGPHSHCIISLVKVYRALQRDNSSLGRFYGIKMIVWIEQGVKIYRKGAICLDV
jgi:hypothetical protein